MGRRNVSEVVEATRHHEQRFEGTSLVSKCSDYALFPINVESLSLFFKVTVEMAMMNEMSDRNF